MKPTNIRIMLCTLALAAAEMFAGEPARPNILLFLVDDMGWQDASVPFHTVRTPLNEKYRTPNMERLAAGGMKFTQAYAYSVCSPSRVSLMTGMSAARHRVTNWTLRKNESPDAKHVTLQFPAWNVNGVCATSSVERTVHATPLPELLRGAGYRTIHIGKAHFGALDTPGADPRNLGFDVNVAGHAPGGPGSYLGEQNYSAAWRKGDRVWDVPGLEKYHGSQTFLTEALTLEAIKAMDQAVSDAKPFFLYMAHYAVHVPFARDSRYYQKYRDAGLGDTEAMYAAVVEGMDKSLGDLMENIKRHGLDKNTIIIFMSDNGGLSVHGRGGKPNTHNAPLSSGKGSAREGGVRVPMLVRWPGVVAADSVCDRNLIIEDFFPTILDMAGVTDRKGIIQTVDGVSFMPLLKQAPGYPENRALFWHFPNNWGSKGPGIGASSSIRKGDWKLIYYHADRQYELFNLREDLSETRNLATEQPDRRTELAAELRTYLQKVDAQMPTDKRTGKVVAWPGE